jgi:hypothetical protein
MTAVNERFERATGRLLVSTAAVAMLLAACATQKIYEGPDLPQAQVAVIEGSPRISAGLPLSAVIRKVDDAVITWQHSTVAVLPGEHHLLVDCILGPTTIRYQLSLNAAAGHHYVIVADSAPGNRSCGDVRIGE